MIKIRVKSLRVPYRRAGLVFAAARQWQEVELVCSPGGLQRVLVIAKDPVLTWQVFNGEEWGPPPSVDDIEAAMPQQLYIEAGPFSEVQMRAIVTAFEADQPDIPPASEVFEETQPIAEAAAEGAPAPTETSPEGVIMPASESHTPDDTKSDGDDAPAPETDVPAIEPEADTPPPAPQPKARPAKGK